MKKAIVFAYVILVLAALGWVEFRRPAFELPWQREPVDPVLSVAMSPPSVSDVTFTFRQGPSRTGVIENETLSLALKKIWESEPINVGIHGASKASPAVDETGIYIGGDNGWFSRFSPEGRVIWRFRADRASFGIHGTALLDREFVYFGAYNGLFYCLRKDDGRVVWAARLGEAIGSSPVADGDFIYVSAETGFGRPASRERVMFHYPERNGRLFKLDRRTGAVVWRTPWAGEQIHSSPTLYDGGRKVGVGANNGFYFSYDAKDGRELWRSDVGGAVKGTAVADPEGRLYLGTYGKMFIALNGVDGHLLWSAPLSGLSQTSAAWVPDLKLLVTAAHERGEVVALRARDGHVVWRVPSGTPLSRSSPVAVRERPGGSWRIWMMCEGASLCAIRPEDGKVLKTWPLGRVFTGAPAVLGGALYLALNEGGLLKFSAQAP